MFAVACLVLVLGSTAMRESRAPHRPRIDLAGAATFVVALAALMLTVSVGAAHDWTAPLTVALGLLAVAGFVAVVVVELRRPTPLLDLRLLRHRGYMGWLCATITMAIGFGAMLAYLPSYLQAPLHLSPAEVGWVMVLPAVPMTVLPQLGARAATRGVAPLHLIVAAMLAIIGGNLWLATLHPQMSVVELVGPLVLLGSGVGIASGILDAQTMNQVADARAGMASGMLNTVRTSGNALSLAIFGAALIAVAASSIGSAELAGQVATGNIPDGPAADVLATRLTDAWQGVLFGLAAFCTCTAVAAVTLIRGAATIRPFGHEEEPATAAAPTP